MISSYIRSSSYNQYSFCQQQHFMTYNLGYVNKAGVKADVGSAAHKVMEWLAIAKKFIQENPDCTSINIEDDLSVDRAELFKEMSLTDDEIFAINKSRSAVSTYMTDCSVSKGATRFGGEVIKYLIDRATCYYSQRSVQAWTKPNFRDAQNYVYIILEYKNGIYNPLKRIIKSPEQNFDIPINEDWARYDYTVGNEKIVGNLAIKGTVDLICELSDDSLEIVDWKTGQRKDWATGEVKTYSKLMTDMQLMMYFYAVSKLYPSYSNVLVTIFFVRDGGPFTVAFEPSDMKVVEDRLKSHFEELKSCKLPTMCSPEQTDFKCTRLCNYYKENWPGTSQNKCRFIHNEIKRIGMDSVIENYKNPDFKFDSYTEPGSN